MKFGQEGLIRSSYLICNFLRRPVEHLQVVDPLRHSRVRHYCACNYGTSISCKQMSKHYAKILALPNLTYRRSLVLVRKYL